MDAYSVILAGVVKAYGQLPVNWTPEDLAAQTVKAGDFRQAFHAPILDFLRALEELL